MNFWAALAKVDFFVSGARGWSWPAIQSQVADPMSALCGHTGNSRGERWTNSRGHYAATQRFQAKSQWTVSTRKKIARIFRVRP